VRVRRISSFSEEKEAKRLLSLGYAAWNGIWQWVPVAFRLPQGAGHFAYLTKQKSFFKKERLSI
jgi:hypothetical protein